MILHLDKHASAKTFARFLKDNHLINNEKLFLLRLRWQKLSTQLQAGVYQIQPGATAEDILQQVIHGQVLVERFQIIEGTTWRQVDKHLHQSPYLSYQNDDVLQINTQALQISDTRQSLPLQNSIEGLLLANTYQYQAGHSAQSMLNFAHQQLVTTVLKAWQARDHALPYHSPYELLIAASILEKESALDQERRLISGVIVNRLAKRMPLQMDPTVIYGLGSQYTGTLTHADILYDSPYNTYRHYGLPPTPIAMVAKASIEAAAHPTPTTYLYFVAKSDGTHVFSENYAEQRQAIQRYIKDK